MTLETYRPRFLRQFGWNTPFDGLNCMMTCAAIALDRETEGDVQITPPKARKLSGDKEGGTNLSDVVTVFRKEDVQKSPWVVYGDDWDHFNRAVGKGRSAILVILYGRVDPAFRSSKTFTGLHAVYVDVVGPKRALVFDPLASKPRWWPLDMLQHAAATAVRQINKKDGTHYPDGSIFAAYTTLPQDAVPVTPADPPADDGSDNAPAPDENPPSEPDTKTELLAAFDATQDEINTTLANFRQKIEGLA